MEGKKHVQEGKNHRKLTGASAEGIVNWSLLAAEGGAKVKMVVVVGWYGVNGGREEGGV